MKTLSKSQKALLLKIRELENLDYSTLDESARHIVTYLHEEKLVNLKMRNILFPNSGSTTVRAPIEYVSISQEGEAYLSSIKKDCFRFWFPTILSITALVFSAVSLLRSLGLI